MNHHCPFCIVYKTFCKRKENCIEFAHKAKRGGVGVFKTYFEFFFSQAWPLKPIMERIPRDSSSVQVELIFIYCSAMDQDHAHPLRFKEM